MKVDINQDVQFESKFKISHNFYNKIFNEIIYSINNVLQSNIIRIMKKNIKKKIKICVWPLCKKSIN